MSYGRDGSFYKDDKERIRADARYEQQERLIEQQKIQNKLLKQQIDKEKQKELYNGVQNWSGHDMLLFIKTMFYIVCFIPMRFTDMSESFNLVLNIILIIFGIVVIYDIYKIIKKYKNNNSNQDKK